MPLFGPPVEGRVTRILVTMAPKAAKDADHVRGWAAAGMDAARINCAHDGPKAWTNMIKNIHEVASEQGRTCPILMDLRNDARSLAVVGRGFGRPRLRLSARGYGRLLIRAAERGWLSGIASRARCKRATASTRLRPSPAPRPHDGFRPLRIPGGHGSGGTERRRCLILRHRGLPSRLC